MPITRCPACRLPSERPFSSLPCTDCEEALLVSPRICPTCLGFTCEPGACTREWIRIEGPPEASTVFAGVHAAYLSLGPGFQILKAWKISRNPPLERLLLRGIRRALEPFQSFPEILLIPVPQSPHRKWELFGGSTLRLCEMISACRRETGLRTRIEERLAVPPTARSSQAKAKGDERYGKGSAFQIAEREKGPSLKQEKGPWPRAHDLPAVPYLPTTPCLLVDDFLTSGSTLRRALQTLRPSIGTRPVHAFLLGFRPSLPATEETEIRKLG